MKKYIWLLIISFLVFITGCSVGNGKEEVVLNVYNWGQYISDGSDGSISVNDEFTKETGIKVNYTTFQSNEELYAKLLGGGANYDVIIPSDYMVSKLIKKGMLHKLNYNNIPNADLIDSKFRNLSYDPKDEYSVPYTWGTIGIFYNKKHVSEKEIAKGWNVLWDEKYRGKILMFDNARDAFAIAHIVLGHSINSENESDWYEAFEKLNQQKPLVQAYVMDQIFDKMANSEAYLATYYAGDAAVMVKNNPDIGFIIPEEGTNQFVDAMCIPIRSNHKEEAEEYINFMCRTDIAKANIKAIGYSTPHKEVYNELSDDIKEDRIFYPDDDVMSKSQIFVDLPSNISSLLDSLWVQVKTGGNGSTGMLVAIILMFVILYIMVVLYKKVKINIINRE